jgi:hypothetical protein
MIADPDHCACTGTVMATAVDYVDEEFGRVGVPPQALGAGLGDSLDQSDAMFDRRGSKVLRPLWTITTSHLAGGRTLI